MFSRFSFLFLAIGLASASLAPLQERDASSAPAFTCSDAMIPVSVTSINPKTILAPPKNQSELTGLFVDLFSVNSNITGKVINGTTEVKANYEIYSELCVPKNWKEGGTLIFAIHGISSDHSYWNFDSPTSKYNFVNSMAKIGVAVFSYDRLGVGKSSKPDGTQEVQAGTQIEIAHTLIQKVRAGSTKLKFGKLVGIGHSFGSIQVSGIAAKYPTDLDHVVLTGFTLFGGSSPLAFAGYSPVIAAENYPQFRNLKSDYFAQANQFTYEFAFFKFGGFENRITQLAQKTLATATLGEILTLTIPLQAGAKDFKGQVFSVVGQEDLIFCGGFCDQIFPGTNQTLVENVATFFPSAAKFDSFIPANTGHATTLHESIDETTLKIQQFLQGL